MYFSVFSPKQVNYLLSSSANSFMIGWQSQFNPLWKATGIFLGTLYSKLLILCAAPLYIHLYNDYYL